MKTLFKALADFQNEVPTIHEETKVLSILIQTLTQFLK